MRDIYVGQLVSSNYLEHHGILGMKWGVRRYQNKDGTLTEEGKKRYDRDTWDVKAQLGARKDYKRVKDHSKSSAVRDEYKRKIKELDETHKRVYRDVEDWGSAEGRKASARIYKERLAMLNEGNTAIRVAKLMEAGYSKRAAEAGAKWMKHNKYNLGMDDRSWAW